MVLIPRLDDQATISWYICSNWKGQEIQRSFFVLVTLLMISLAYIWSTCRQATKFHTIDTFHSFTIVLRYHYWHNLPRKMQHNHNPAYQVILKTRNWKPYWTQAVWYEQIIISQHNLTSAPSSQLTSKEYQTIQGLVIILRTETKKCQTPRHTHLHVFTWSFCSNPDQTWMFYMKNFSWMPTNASRESLSTQMCSHAVCPDWNLDTWFWVWTLGRESLIQLKAAWWNEMWGGPCVYGVHRIIWKMPDMESTLFCLFPRKSYPIHYFSFIASHKLSWLRYLGMDKTYILIISFLYSSFSSPTVHSLFFLIFSRKNSNKKIIIIKIYIHTSVIIHVQIIIIALKSFLNSKNYLNQVDFVTELNFENNFIPTDLIFQIIS